LIKRCCLHLRLDSTGVWGTTSFFKRLIKRCCLPRFARQAPPVRQHWGYAEATSFLKKRRVIGLLEARILLQYHIQLSIYPLRCCVGSRALMLQFPATVLRPGH